MISLLRFILFVVLFYYLFKWIKNLMLREGQRRARVKGNNAGNDTPPPYDPNKVEDIDYKEVKKKNNRR